MRTGIVGMALGAALAVGCGGATVNRRPPQRVVVPPLPRNPDWCQAQALPPLPAFETQRALIAQGGDPKLLQELARLNVQVKAQYANALVIRASEAELAALRSRGIAAEPDPAGDIVVFHGVYFITSAGMDSPKGQPPPPAWLMRLGTADRVPWLVQLVGPPSTEWMNTLTGTGVTVVDPKVPSNALVVRMTAPEAQVVSKLAFVNWLAPIEPVHKIDPGLLGLSCPVPSTEAAALARVALPRALGERMPVHIRLLEQNPDAARGVAAEVESRKGKVRRDQLTAASVVAEVPPEALPNLAALSDVALIERWTPPLPLSSGVQLRR